MMKSFVSFSTVVCLLTISLSQAQEKFFRAIGTPHQPKVEVSWNRYYTYDGLVDIMQKIAKAHPQLAKLQSIGKSVEGREIWSLTISDFGTGNPNRKPAMYIDVKIYDAIAKKGEEMIPGYRYLVVYKDLYSVFGGELDWFYGGRGIYTYTNELMVSYLYYHKNEVRANQEEELKVDKYLTFGDAFVPWETYQHPQFGAIEVGGFKKNFSRAHPGFLLEQDAHRNMAFTLYHGYHTPKLSVLDVQEEALGNGLTALTATIYNERLMPTHSGQDLKYNIERPDYITIKGAKVLAGMIVENADFNIVKEQRNSPEKIAVPNIPGMGTVKVRWIVSGSGNYSLTVDSAKGGVVDWKN
ncbi:M14 family zinc carboxypeptidase [Arenibacter sp. GZD96]|uniref:M14 family zinc carboxypeptidase n=1 Tax=Aurantibrevibacter litoralis TaxID=3106030 RepID=UPI002AFEE083|nr:M14 family zinc carboxypeptidase [Arenibacter sp. GZD-96]MEA1787455.1 M14 family zinc carboxypeptidase [Arenibacter sp. GZD-96]